MDKAAREEMFLAILASSILAPSLDQDPNLSEIVKSSTHPDIHYFDRPSPAGQTGLALKQRLAHWNARKIQHNLEATKQLVAFCELHPESEIYNVTFNSRTRHYGVRCSRVDGRLHVICVMTGGRLPGTLLGESDP